MNRGRFLRHPCEWEPTHFVEASWDEAKENPEAIIARPRAYALGYQWTQVRAQDNEPGPAHRQGYQHIEPSSLPRRLARAVFKDFARRYTTANAPPPKFQPIRKMRSLGIEDVPVTFDGTRELTFKVPGGPGFARDCSRDWAKMTV